LPETIDRSRDLTVTWDPGGLGGDTMVVSVVAFGAREPDPDNPGATRIEVHEIQCHAALADGSVTIPADSLVQSFASEEAAIGLSLLGAPGYTVRFTTPGIEYATFTQTASYSQSAVVR
jgi:hypothetical protein